MKKIGIGLLASAMGTLSLAAKEKPNIIFFLVDDMG